MENKFGLRSPMGGSGKIHIHGAWEDTVLCGLICRGGTEPWGIEDVLKSARVIEDVLRPGVCKNCIRVAKTRRGVLDRLAEISDKHTLGPGMSAWLLS